MTDKDRKFVEHLIKRNDLKWIRKIEKDRFCSEFMLKLEHHRIIISKNDDYIEITVRNKDDYIIHFIRESHLTVSMQEGEYFKVVGITKTVNNDYVLLLSLFSSIQDRIIESSDIYNNIIKELNDRNQQTS